MVSQTKTHIFNVTYLGQVVYDIVQDAVKVNKKLGLLDRTQVGAIFSLFADAVKKPSPKLPLGNPDIGVAMLAAIQRGAIEQPITSYKSRGCMPLLTEATRKVMEKIYEAVEQEKQAWLKREGADGPSPKPISNDTWYTKVVEAIYFFLERSKDGAQKLGGFGSWTSQDIWEGLTFPAHSNAAQAELNLYKRTRADYYWDKKGRLGFNDDAINMYYHKTSDKLDPENGERNLHSYLEVAARNEEAQKAGAYPKNTCLVCGEDLPVKAPGTRGPKQKYCTTCKPFVKLAMDEESNMRRNRLNMESSVPKEDFLFVKYMNNMYIKNKSTKKVTVKDIVKTSVKKPKGKKPENFKPDLCECGGCNFEIYKPWKPDESGKFGKIGSKVLYCKDCGLVVGYGQQSTSTTGEI